MNVLTSNKFIATTLIFMLAITVARLPLPAKERKGSTVVVTLIDGSKVKGELLAVKKDALLVYDSSARQGKSIDLRQIAKVKVLKTFWVLTGMVFGLGVGMGISKLTVNSNKTDFHDIGNYLLLPFITTLSGVIIGASASLPKKISLIGESSQSVQQNLEQLKRYAREKDTEKPVDLEEVAKLK